jgi:hypothetical protein
MAEPKEVVDRAIALAGSASSLAATNGDPMEELVGAGRPTLEAARAALVQRIYLRSDDYEATAALRLVNQALAALGWEDPYNWKHRRKP